MAGKRNQRTKSGAKPKQATQSGDLARLLAVIKNQQVKKPPPARVAPFFPLAGEGDIRPHFTASDLYITCNSILTALKQGAGTATLSDSGRIVYTVDIGLPTRNTTRLIRLTSKSE